MCVVQIVPVSLRIGRISINVFNVICIHIKFWISIKILNIQVQNNVPVGVIVPKNRHWLATRLCTEVAITLSAHALVSLKIDGFYESEKMIFHLYQLRNN